MSHNSRVQKIQTQSKQGKNVILVANGSNLQGGGQLDFLFSRNSSRYVPQFGKNSSISNLFQGFHHETKPKEQIVRRQEVLTDSQRYAQECLEYEKYFFDDKIRLIIHRMAILAYHSFKQKIDHSFLTFFIERYLCTLAKKLLLNRFELLFLQYVLQESKWKYDIDLIHNIADEFKSFVHTTESQSPQGTVKNLQIYLLFCAFYSKKSLNDLATENIYNQFLRSLNERFKERYQEWSQTSGVTKFKINPKLLNLIFRKLTSFHQKERDFTQNYNLLVEEILEISPAYNADKEGKSRKKRKKNQQEEQKQKQKYPMKQPQSNNIQELSPELPALDFRKKKTSYVSNIDGFDPVAYYNRGNN